MADVFYGVDRGEVEEDVVRDTSTTSKDVELVIDDAKNLSRAEILIAMDFFKNAILKQADPF